MNDFKIDEFRSILYVCDPGGRRTVFPSRHSSCFIMTLSGRIRFTFQEECIETDVHQGIFIPKGANYLNHCLEGAESILINFDTAVPVPRPVRLNPPDRKTAMSFYENIRRHALTDTPQDRLYILSQLYLLAHHLFPAEPGVSPREALANRAYRFLQDRLSRPDLQIEEAARHCGVSTVYLRKLFGEFYGKAPFAVLTDLRMARAHAMLLEKRPVKEIAFAAGYSDIYQFSRAYKRYFGFSPSRTGL